MAVRIGPYGRLSAKELRIVALEKALEGPLDCKETRSVDPKGNPECPLEGQLLKLRLKSFGHLRSGLTGEDPDGVGEDGRPKEKGMAEEEG